MNRRKWKNYPTREIRLSIDSNSSLKNYSHKQTVQNEEKPGKLGIPQPRVKMSTSNVGNFMKLSNSIKVGPLASSESEKTKSKFSGAQSIVKNLLNIKTKFRK